MGYQVVNVTFSFTSFAVTAILFCNKSPIALAEAISFIIAEIKCGWLFSSFIVLRQIFPVKRRPILVLKPKVFGGGGI